MERRLVHRALETWRALAKGRRHPARAEVGEATLRDLWPQCFILELGRHAADPVFRHCGDGFVRPPGAMLVGTHLSALPPRSLVAHAIEHVAEVIEKDVPVARGGSFTDAAGAVCKFRSILLPLGDGGLTHLLGAANSSNSGEEP